MRIRGIGWLASDLARLPLVSVPVYVGDREWRITTARDQGALLDIAVDADELAYGLLLWESAITLAHVLYSGRMLYHAKRILELGAGVGLPGIVAQWCGADVCQTDYTPITLALARQNATQNGVGGINWFVGDWRDWKHAARYDLIIGSDILYDRSLHYCLVELFHRNLRPGGMLLLTDPGRPQASEFVSLLELHEWNVESKKELVDPVQSTGPVKPIEVTVLTCTTR